MPEGSIKPPRTERRIRDPARTRESILATAEAEFARHGFGGGRVDRIARKARANKRMIYHYFGHKDGLYLAVLERVYAAKRSAERALEVDHRDPRRRSACWSTSTSTTAATIPSSSCCSTTRTCTARAISAARAS